jgi:flagellar motor switch protein FliN/FliY
VRAVSENFLSQEEIDALLKSQVVSEQETESEQEHQTSTPAGEEEDLTQEERDVLGEIGNISMGSAATTLSDIVQHRVSITTPHVILSNQKELFGSFVKPYVVIDINYIEGLTGSNLLLVGLTDAAIIADLMMGGTGENVGEELSEMGLSAVSEAMNQMIGSAATAMSNMFGFPVVISPPRATVVEFDKQELEFDLNGNAIAVVSFKLVVGNLIDSQIMQLIPVKAAKEIVKYLLAPSAGDNRSPGATAEDGDVEEDNGLEDFVPGSPSDREIQPKEIKDDTFSTRMASFTPGAGEDVERGKNLDLILDVPLKVSVVLGRCKKPIGEVLKLVPGTIVELDSLADEPVDILVNGTLIAQGEVVVVNENFGVQVNNIISPEERLRRLRD